MQVRVGDWLLLHSRLVDEGAREEEIAPGGTLVLVDEGTRLPTLTAYPLVGHARGVVGHATSGPAAGVLLALVDDGRPGPGPGDPR
ncbi:hypothetical protein [Blastococcus sp. SYSU DS0533]